LLQRLVGARGFHKSVEDSLQRLKRAAEEKVQQLEIRKGGKGDTVTNWSEPFAAADQPPDWRLFPLPRSLPREPAAERCRSHAKG